MRTGRLPSEDYITSFIEIKNVMFRVKPYWVNSRPEYSVMVISEQGLASGLQPTVHLGETSLPDTLFGILGIIRINFSRLVRASPASSTPGPSPLILSQTRVPGLQALS